jgi:imidazolonepropionase-like amidohydrolase
MHALQTEEFTVRAEVLPSPAILKHCTTNAAQMLRMEGKIGIIRAGAFADLLILNANPLEDVTVLDRPEEHLLAWSRGWQSMRSYKHTRIPHRRKSFSSYLFQ